MTNDQSPMTCTLFDMEAVRMDSPRLRLIKAFDIQTHHVPGAGPYEWLAIPMNAAREEVELYAELAEAEAASVAGITSRHAGTLMSAGLLFYGASEREVQDDAVAWCWAEEIRITRAKDAKSAKGEA